MILVTGGTGLVGSHLLYALAQKNEPILATFRTKEKIEKVKDVFSIYTKNHANLFSKIQWVKGDITNIPLLEKIFIKHTITEVYHCAAFISFEPKDYSKMRSINIYGTANIVNLSIDHKIEKFCYVSSIAAIGDKINNNPITEENQWNDQTPKSDYAITKYGAEMEVWRASQEGLNIVIVNPGVILGNGFKEGSSEIFYRVKKGLKFFTEGQTGFIGVKDVVKSMLLLMENNKFNQRFILVSQNKTFKEIMFKISDEFNTKRPSIKVGKVITEIGWRIDSVLSFILSKKPLITKHTARSLHNIDSYNNEKIKQEININFEKIDDVIAFICNKN